MRDFISLTLFLAAVGIAIYLKLKLTTMVGLYLVGYVVSLGLMYMAGTLAEKTDWSTFQKRMKDLWDEYKKSHEETLKKLRDAQTGQAAIVPPV